MRIIIKPGGIAAILAVLLFLCGLLAFSRSREKKPVAVADPTPNTAPAPAAPNAPEANTPPPSEQRGATVPVALMFGSGAGDAGKVSVTGQAVNGAASKTLPTGTSFTLGRDARQYVDLGKPLINTTQSFSLSAWVRLNDTSGFQTFVSQDGKAISSFYFQKRQDSGQFALTLNSEDSTKAANPGSTSTRGYEAESGFSAEAGKWYHLVGIYDDSAHVVKLYVNGVLKQTNKVPAAVHPWQASGHTIIGAALWEAKRVDYVNGTVENVRIYPRPLTDADVTRLYKNRL